MAESEQVGKTKSRESSIRWQGRAIEQLGYALNLILGLSVAAIGFEATLLLSDAFDTTGWQIWLFVASMLFLLISAAAGLWCVVNRLMDFSATARIARKREDGAPASELQPLRERTRALGKRTWALFCWQIVTFGSGVLFLVAAVAARLAATMSAV